MEYIKLTKKSVKAARKLLKKAFDYANEFPNFTAKDVFWMWGVASTILHDEGIKEVNFGKNKYGGYLMELEVNGKMVLVCVDEKGVKIWDYNDGKKVVRKQFTKRKKIENIIKEIKKGGTL